MSFPSSEEVSSLLESISAFAGRLQCSFGDAVQRLKALADAPSVQAPPAFPTERPRRDTREFARHLLRVRALRSKMLGADTFRDPAWDMLLDLYVGEPDGGPIMISSLCIASGVPQTTALRHVYRLVDAGMIHCASDPTDHRRNIVRLAPHMKPRIRELLVMIQDCA